MGKRFNFTLVVGTNSATTLDALNVIDDSKRVGSKQCLLLKFLQKCGLSTVT